MAVLVNLLYCEFLKLKRSKILLVSVLGALITPMIIFLLGVQIHFSGSEERIARLSMNIFYYDFLLYNMLLFGIIVYAVMGAHLFSREYTENTLKTILVIPVQKQVFIINKFAMLFIWVMLMMLISWFSLFILSAIYHVLFGLTGFGVEVPFNQLGNVMLGGALMYITISPFIFLSLITKGFIVPVIAAVAITMTTVVVINGSWNVLWPWAATYLLVTDQVSQAEYSYPIVIGIIAFVSILGFALSAIFFQREDIK